jgi:cytochrome b561/polyisoprenoid-binding protein YceI
LDAETHARYSGGAILFHWVIAVLILANFLIAWTMGDRSLDKTLSFALFQLHKTVGITVLLLTFGRLAWRLMNPPPPLPASMKPWEKRLSHGVHILFYVAMIILPLLGWMTVSASPTGIPTYLFGVVPWPHIAPLANMPISAKEGAYEFFEIGHELAAWFMLFLLGLHVAGALKHQLLDKQQSLARMAPGLFGWTSGPAQPPRGAAIALGLVALLFAAGAAIGVLGGTSRPPVTAPLAADAPAEPVVAGEWVVDPQSSKIEFEGRHGSKIFKGRFDQWTARIQFDPENIERASARVNIKTGSASTGDTYYDSTLPSADWFDAAKFPTATFLSKSFRRTGSGTYEVDGELTIRGVTKSLTFPFELRGGSQKADMTAELTIKRLDFGVGAAADPRAEWVSNPIRIKLEVKAKRPVGA